MYTKKRIAILFHQPFQATAKFITRGKMMQSAALPALMPI